MRIRPGIELANLTDRGCEREENEDYFCYVEPASEEQFARKGRFAAIADGMGGHQGGQVASRLAVEVVREAYLESRAGPEAALVEAFRAAHEAIQRYAADHPDLRGMGTTCTALSLLDGCLYFAHVGDSRLYLIRGSTITRLTHDHSYVSRLVAAGILQPEEAENHPDRYILAAALGADSALQAEVPEAPIKVEAGDILLLCTDGLHGLVSDDEILASAIRSEPSEACRELVQLVKDRGGPDNITIQILLVRVPAGACGKQAVSTASGKEGQT